MLEFGQDYAKQIVKNSKALAQSLYERGFDVLCEELGFTESHQLAINVSNIRSASDIAHDLANNDVILNKNLLPGDNVDDSDNPSGLRIGTQEITRRGLKEKEMDEVAGFVMDAAVPGSGKTFDWDLLQKLPSTEKQVLLAGGLNPDNVGEALAACAGKIDGVGTSSGVERTDGNGKSKERIEAFVRVVRGSK